MHHVSKHGPRGKGGKGGGEKMEEARHTAVLPCLSVSTQHSAIQQKNEGAGMPNGPWASSMKTFLE